MWEYEIKIIRRTKCTHRKRKRNTKYKILQAIKKTIKGFNIISLVITIINGRKLHEEILQTLHKMLFIKLTNEICEIFKGQKCIKKLEVRRTDESRKISIIRKGKDDHEK